MSSSNLSSSVRMAARASSMRRIMSVASASGAFAQALNRKASQRSARSSHSAELGSSKLEDEIAHLVDCEVDSGEDDEPQPAPFVAKLAAESPSSGMPRSMSFVARRKRRGSANISHTLSSSAGLAAMPEAEDDDDSEEEDSEAGDAFDSGAGDDNIWAKPSPMVVRKAMPRVPSMIPKRRRKGSVAMEDLDHKRALLHVHAERLHEGEEEDGEEAKLQSRARGRGGDNARARKRSVHEVVPQGKGMVRVPSMLPKRKRKGSTTMGSINHTYTALHALNEGEDEAGSDDEDSHSGEDDLSSPYDTPAVSIALPASGRSIPRTASMVPKRKRKGSVAMDSIETGRTLLHAVLEAPAELTGSEGASDSDSEDDSDSDAPAGERRDSLGAKPNYFKRRGRRSSGVHTAPGGEVAGLEDLQQRGMVRAPSMIPKRKRRGSSAMESIDVPRAPLGAVAEVGASQRSIDTVGDGRDVFDFEAGLGASPVVAAGRGVHSSAQQRGAAQQEVVQRGMPRVPSSMPLRKRRGSSAVEDVDFTSMELPTTIHEHDDFDSDDDDESERSDSIAPMRPRAPAQSSRASGGSRPSAHRQGWGEPGGGQGGSGGGRGMPKTRSLYQKRKRKGSSSAVVLQPASAMGALHEVDEDDDEEDEQPQRRAGAPSTPDTAVLGRNLFAVGHGFVPASSLQSREEAQRFRQAPRATEAVRASKPTAPKRGVRRPHKLQTGQRLAAPKRLGAVSPVSRAMPRVPSMLPKRRRKGSTAMNAVEHTPNNLHGPILEETPLQQLGVPDGPPSSRSRGRRSSGVHASPVAGARVTPRTVPVRSPSFMPKRQRKGSTAMETMPQFSRTVLTAIDDDVNSSSDTLGTLGASLQSVTVVEDEEVEFVTGGSRYPTPPAMPRMRGSASEQRLGVSGSHLDLLTRQGSSPSLPGSGGRSSRSGSRGPVRASHALPPPRTTNARLRTRGARTAAVPQRQASVKSPMVRTPSNMPRRKRRGSTSLDALDHRRSVLTKIAEKTGMPGMARQGSSGRLRGPAGPLPSPRAPDQGRRGSSDLAPRMVGSSRRIGIGRLDSSNKLTSLGNLKNQGSRSSLPGLQSPRQVASAGLMSSGSGRVRHTEATREAARRSLARKQSARAAAARR